MAGHELHRLESYQSGGSIGGNETKEETTKVGSTPVLHSQFSLIGRSSDDGSERGDTFERSAKKFCAFPHPQQKLVLAFCLCIYILIVAVSFSFGKFSQEKSLEQNSCPIQTSFGVTQDVMKDESIHSIHKSNGAVHMRPRIICCK